MKYLGSKRRIAKELLEIILKYRKNDEQYFVDAFCGGCNIICEVKGNRIANDSNEYIISMWKSLVNGWIPPNYISEEEYYNIKNNKQNYPKELVGFAGIAVTFGSTWFGTYARNKRGTNYAMEGRENLYKQVDKLKNVIFASNSYDELIIPDNSIIYCDIPYFGVTGYKDKFNHEKFYKWCFEQKNKGHLIFISEYNMPEDFTCIYEKKY